KAELDAAKAAITLAEQASEAQGKLGPLREAVEKDASNLEARFNLACALMAASENEEAAEHLLEIIRRDRSWNDDAARKQLITLFDALGPTDPLTVKSRRALSSMLFS
ncbi:MAG: tetratricopeptide repeat protein, partial [Alphaproteobacteria bacterium]|nr:tetratricopeptide repeat protein [Alphaproteobacteria bacterium]